MLEASTTTAATAAAAAALNYDESKFDNDLRLLHITESKHDDDESGDVTTASSAPADDQSVHQYGYFTYLPCEITTKIFTFLPLPDLLNTALVCRLFRDHSYDQRHLVAINLQPYWHFADVNLLDCLTARFPCCPAEEEEDNMMNSKVSGWLVG